MSAPHNVQTELDNSTRERVADARAWFAEFHSEGGDGGRSWLSLGGVRGDDEGPDWAELVSCDRIPTDPAELGQFLDGLADYAVQASGEPGTNVFAAVYPFGIAGRQRGGARVRRHVQADIDGPTDLGRARMLGAMVVASGGTATREDGTEADKTHVYVRMSEPLDEETHRVLCEALGRFVGGRFADTSKTGDDLVLRVPGTLHDKGQPGDPRPVRWITRPDDPSVRTWAPADLARMLSVELGGDRDDEETPGSALEPEGAPREHPGAAGALDARLARAVAAGEHVEPLAPDLARRRLDAQLDRLGDPQCTPVGTRDDRANYTAYLAGGLARRVYEHEGQRLPDEWALEGLRDLVQSAAMQVGLTAREADKLHAIRKGWADPGGAARDRSAADRTVPTETVQEVAERAEETTAGVHVSEGVTPCRMYGVVGHDPLACPDCLAAREQAREIYRDRRAVASGLPAADTLLMPGGAAILDAPACPVPVWGRGSRALWAEGESLILLGAAGLGKTTLAQQLALGRCGAPGFADLLGLPVAPDGRRVLYLAMDRPKQAVRSIRRMVSEDMRALLDARLRIWSGPPPVTLTDHPERLAEMCEQAGAGTVVVDSLKDTGSVVDDEGGTGWNRARQLALAAGVEVLELQHPRKLPEGQTMPRLEDSYGSTWITAGAGSVLALGGRAGDRVVKLEHLKQPAEAWGPAEMTHDHERGRSDLVERVDLVARAAAAGPLTALDAARLMTGSDRPDRRAKEAARRKLQALERSGSLVLLPGSGGNAPDSWGPAVRIAR